MTLRRIVGLVGAMVCVACGSHAAVARSTDAETLCRSIGSRVAAVERDGATAGVLLRSYDPGEGETALPPPLASTAFTYDNALAAIALTGCGDLAHARRIADAFVTAVDDDRQFHDGRIRNAYRAGAMRRPALLPGWWDGDKNLWAEDAYQDGSQTGNAAWAGLALLSVAQADSTSSSRYIEAAMKLAGWISKQRADATPGFRGGLDGFDRQQSLLLWKSTEHNVDAYAFGRWLARTGHGTLGDKLSRSARGFLDRMWDEQAGMFRLGTRPDGQVQPSNKYALDALIWPLLAVEDAPNAWDRSLQFAQKHLAAGDGFTFAVSGAGVWTEGTAQAATVLQARRQTKTAERALELAMRQLAPTGYLYATAGGTVATGLRVSAASTSDDFFYFHRPHLGATAWAAIAALHLNPFTGRTVGP